LAFLLLMAFLLFLASLLILAFLFYWWLYILTVQWDILLDYRTIAIELLFFSAIGLSDHWVSDWWIQETIRLLDIRPRSQSIGLSDIGLRKNYRLAASYYHCGRAMCVRSYQWEGQYTTVQYISNRGCSQTKSQVGGSPHACTKDATVNAS
jgi:hypothetical protein